MSAAPPRVAIHGATGRLGRLIAAEAGAAYAGPIGRSGPVPPCEVVIDVSRPEGLAALLPRLDGQPLLVGTTGALPEAALAAYAARAPVRVAANFGLGIPLLLDILPRIVAALPPGWDIELVESHHAAKADAPSGTALRLGAALGRPVPMHSLRVGDTVGEHTLVLAGPGERLTLTHTATRREVFAIGAPRHAAALVGAPPGLTRV